MPGRRPPHCSESFALGLRRNARFPLKLTLITASTAPGTDDELLVKITPKKELKDGVIRPNGTIKLKRPGPKHNKPGNWRDDVVVDGQ